ncbi:hypothetical protein ACX0FC_19465, partial [Enterococcus faecium]
MTITPTWVLWAVAVTVFFALQLVSTNATLNIPWYILWGIPIAVLVLGESLQKWQKGRARPEDRLQIETEDRVA